MDIVWLKLAQIDLGQIRSYYSENAGQKIADTLLKKIVHSTKLIQEHPYIGNNTEQDDLMEWSIPKIPFTLPYRLKNNEIQILRVFHESQERPDYWQ